MLQGEKKISVLKTEHVEKDFVQMIEKGKIPESIVLLFSATSVCQIIW